MTSVPPGIDCGDICNAWFPQDATVTLTATADPGSVFKGWSGGGCPATGPCELSLTGDTTITATFADASAFTTVTMVSPNGGERLPSGGSWTLAWGGPAEVTSYKLYYSLNNGLTWKSITTDTGTTTLWTLPTVKKNTTTCRTKVIGYNGTTKIGVDKSNIPFTIEVVRLTYPDRGESFPSGSDITVAWTTYATMNPVSQIQLSYSLDNGATWKAFDSQPPTNAGSYQVTLPEVNKPKFNCKVKVVLKDASGKKVGTDVSDGVFTINP